MDVFCGAMTVRVLQHDSALGEWRLARCSPGTALQPYVIELCDLDAQQVYTRERFLPRTRFDLLINLRDEHGAHRSTAGSERTDLHGAWIAGLHERFRDVERPADTRLMAVRLTSAGAHALLRVPLRELTNRVVLLEDVIGRGVERLRDQLREAPSPTARFRILENWLVRRFAGAPCSHPVVSALLQAIARTSGSCQVGRTVRAFGVSHKHAITLFHNQVGLPPKAFARLVRFNALLSAVRAAPRVRWTEIAHRFQYFDQAHFGREFRQLTGVTPSAFVAARGPDGDTILVR